MDFQRVLLFVALSIVILLLWNAWQKDYGTRPPVTATGQVQQQAPAERAEAPPVPEAPAAKSQPTPQPALPSGKRIQVTTDLMRAEIDTDGGDLRQVELLKYPVSVEQPKNPIRLLNDHDGHLFIAQSGLRATSGAAPDHHAVFTAADTHYELAPGKDTLKVRLTWRSDTGVEVAKVYTFHRGSYLVDVGFEVRNGSDQPWVGHMYQQLQHGQPPKSPHAFGVHTYTGGVIYSPEKKYEKISFKDMTESDLNRDITGGWSAIIQHYFLAAWVPQAKAPERYYTKAVDSDRYIIGMIGPARNVAPGQQGSTEARLYVGPKLQKRLEAVAPGLELTVDYGMLTFIAKPIYWLMATIHSILGNWGWSIILLTIFIKLAFYKLSETSYKSMANMRKMQPRMAAIKERFGDDRQKMNEAMMRLYKEEKINPLGGCLPIVVQIPVFIALYWVLLGSVELRQAPFIFWIHDLSTKDPYYVLPILMGISMVFQQRLNPSPMDPIQAKVMMILPIAFTFFFAFFPSGLVIYWVVNNVLSIAQQWYITRRVVKA
jgi:YidC/Oxa1 family membrane protein insertase